MIHPIRPGPIPARARFLWREQILARVLFLGPAQILLPAPLLLPALLLLRAQLRQGRPPLPRPARIPGRERIRDWEPIPGEEFRGERSVPGSCLPWAHARAAEAISRWLPVRLSECPEYARPSYSTSLSSYREKPVRQPRRTRRSVRRSSRAAIGWRCSTCAVPRLWRLSVYASWLVVMAKGLEVCPGAEVRDQHDCQHDARNQRADDRDDSSAGAGGMSVVLDTTTAPGEKDLLYVR